MPARGPDASQRTSLAIFISGTAIVRNALLTLTIGSSEADARRTCSAR